MSSDGNSGSSPATRRRRRSRGRGHGRYYDLPARGSNETGHLSSVAVRWPGGRGRSLVSEVKLYRRFQVHGPICFVGPGRGASPPPVSGFYIRRALGSRIKIRYSSRAGSSARGGRTGPTRLRRRSPINSYVVTTRSSAGETRIEMRL
ncbi:hypothetical protein EVAR_33634_1 [Eumeta japonica]|uniref:Uncharacterized protein n=1 Tax=Eumeta variegata TaxID=151549 RepID=A0A4C1WCQ3_EUMVA|nr:hypothetical protein EVAR_33634_1 [Eumeta japonica]